MPTTATIINADCLAALATMPDNSVHAIVTDPPYGLANTSPAQVADTITRWVSGERDYLPSGAGFMGKAWDAFVPPVAVWDECLRVLKPGGHVLAFAGSRTVDLMTLGLRLAGFDIRDSIAWLYGSGFPKSLDVSKAIQRELTRELTRELEFTAWMRTTGITSAQINEATGTAMGGHYLTAKSQPAVPTAALMDKMRHLLPEVPEWIEDEIAAREAAKAESAERNRDVRFLQALNLNSDPLVVEDDVALDWQGWGTALKPAFEPVVVARKPLEGTVAANVQEHGTGAMNIDGCRIGNEVRVWRDDAEATVATGRWPANVILDESQAAELDRQSGESTSRIGKPRGAAAGDGWGMTATGAEYSDSGGASRFFYVAKASKAERPNVNGVAHPTVKPLALMRWLVRLVTPPGGHVVDPFAGSGTTVEAALLEGFDVTGIERDADFIPLIRSRVDRFNGQGLTTQPLLWE